MVTAAPAGAGLMAGPRGWINMWTGADAVLTLGEEGVNKGWNLLRFPAVTIEKGGEMPHRYRGCHFGFLERN